MPCLVTERSGTNISGVYNLYYDESGRLTKAARQQTLTDCPALDEKCRKFLGSENMATTYSYDDQGRLNQVTQNFDAGRKGVLQLKYDTGGRLTGYEFKEGLENGKENSHTGTVKYGADGRVAGLSERGKVFIGGMQDASEDYTVVAAPQDGPYAGSAIVWPFGINTPYLGWRVARRVTAVTGKYGGRRTTTEKYGFDRNGNIIVFTMDSGGAWGFSYDCSE